MTRTRSLAALTLSLAACVGVGLFASLFRPGEWYQALARPSWTPPDWLFAPVWAVLYVAMAVAAWRVWRRGGLAGARTALALFALQLALNAAWSWVFFGLHRIGLGLADLVLLLLVLLATTVAFFRHDRVAGWLLVPYVAWASFATALNAAIWRLN